MVLCYHESNFDLSWLLNSHLGNCERSVGLLASLWLGLAAWAVDGPRCCGPHVGHVDRATWTWAARRLRVEEQAVGGWGLCMGVLTS